MYVCARNPALAKIKVFLDTVPRARVKLAARKDVDSRAGRNCYICNHKTGMVRGHNIVQRGGQDPELLVEEPDDGESKYRQRRKLAYCANLEYD